MTEPVKEAESSPQQTSQPPDGGGQEKNQETSENVTNEVELNTKLVTTPTPTTTTNQETPTTMTSVPESTSVHMEDAINAVALACAGPFENNDNTLTLFSAPPSTDKENSGDGNLAKDKKPPRKPRLPTSKNASGSPKRRGRKSKEWYMERGRIPPDFTLKTVQSKKGSGGQQAPLFTESSEPRIGLKQKKALAAINGSESGGHYYGTNGNFITTKDILDCIFLDHNYCQVLYSTNRSKVQPFRHIFGPKDEYKAQFFPENLISPNKFLPPVPSPPPLTSSPPVRSKLEYLLKGGHPSSPMINQRSSSSSTPTKKYWEAHDETDDEIDVVAISRDFRENIPYDSVKAKSLMMQCDKHSKIIKSLDEDENWEDQIIRTGWTVTQRKLFDTVVKALHQERLSRLANDKNPAEPILRRCSLDKATTKIRCALTQIHWNSRLTQWLHGVLIDNLNQAYLAIYLDILQSLKAYAPYLVDKMIVLSTASSKNHNYESPPPLPPIEVLHTNANPDPTVLSSISDNISSNSPKILQNSMEDKNTANALKEVLVKKANHLSADALNLLLKKPWDPFSPVVHHSRLKRLPCNPVFLYIPCVTPISSPSSMRRSKNFSIMLAALGKVISLNVHAAQCSTISKFALNILNVTKAKILEMKKIHPDRPLFLIGWGTGSIIAATAAITHPVDGVIALSFPMFGLAGPRGTLEDPILDMKKPILFIIGGRSPDVNVTDMELLRKQLNCESSMVVIGCGDKHLRIARYHRERLLVTQSWVDKCIVDEVAYFINLHSKHQQVSSAASLDRSLGKYRKSIPLLEHKEKQRARITSTGSCASSVDIKPLCSGGEDLMLGENSFNLDDSGLSSDSRTSSTPTGELITKSRKRSGSSISKEPTAKKKIKAKQQKVDEGNKIVDASQNDELNRKNANPSESEYVSPVLTYMGASGSGVGQGGLLHNLLSPSLPSGNSGTNSNEDKNKISIKLEPANPTVVPPPSIIVPTITRPPTVLAGGATATPVQGPIIPTFSSLDTMRQYMIQHQHVMKQQLIQIQHQQLTTVSSTAASSTISPSPLPSLASNNIQQQSPQLLRLLTPPRIPTPTTTTGPSFEIGGHPPSSAPYAAPSTDEEIGPVKLPSDLNVTVIKPGTQLSSSSSSLISTASGSQLASSSLELPKTITTFCKFQPISNLNALTAPKSPAPTPLQSQMPPPQHHKSVDNAKNVEQNSSSPIRFQTVVNTDKSGHSASPVPIQIKTPDKTINTCLRQVDINALLEGGVVRFIVPGESDPLTIILRHPQPLSSTAAAQPAQSPSSLSPSLSLVRPTQPLSQTQRPNNSSVVFSPLITRPQITNVQRSSSPMVNNVMEVVDESSQSESESSLEKEMPTPIITSVKSLASQVNQKADDNISKSSLSSSKDVQSPSPPLSVFAKKSSPPLTVTKKGKMETKQYGQKQNAKAKVQKILDVVTKGTQMMEDATTKEIAEKESNAKKPKKSAKAEESHITKKTVKKLKPEASSTKAARSNNNVPSSSSSSSSSSSTSNSSITPNNINNIKSSTTLLASQDPKGKDSKSSSPPPENRTRKRAHSSTSQPDTSKIPKLSSTPESSTTLATPVKSLKKQQVKKKQSSTLGGDNNNKEKEKPSDNSDDTASTDVPNPNPPRLTRSMRRQSSINN